MLYEPFTIMAIAGPSGCGKTRSLLLMRERFNVLGSTVRLFGSHRNQERDGGLLRSRDETIQPAPIQSIESPYEMLDHKDDTHVFILDEINLFDSKLVSAFIEVAFELRLRRQLLIGSGCNLTSELEPYSPMVEFMAIADRVVILPSRTCHCCDGERFPALYSWYAGEDKPPADSDDAKVGFDFVSVCGPCYKALREKRGRVFHL